MHRSKQKCIRCVVDIHVTKVEWQDSNGVSLILEGPSVFVRACVLGQLQHSNLHPPTFPLSLHTMLTFDRVFTNCHDPTLFREVIRGEHIKFELIQISPDFRGGKILAKFDTPAHKFLSPDSVSKEELRQITLDKSRKYQHPPVLSCTCSTTLSEVTVHSPVDSLLEDTTTQRNKQTRSEPTLITATHHTPLHSDGTHDEEYTRLKLHSLLDGYRELSKTEPSTGKKSPYRVKFKPPVPKLSKPRIHAHRSPSPTRHMTTPTSLYESTTTRLGPHHWEVCPRRSPKRQRSYSAPSSPARKVRATRHAHFMSDSIRPMSADHDHSLTLSDLNDTPPDSGPVDTRPPFVVRRIDPHLLERRDFCGCSPSKTGSLSYRSSTYGTESGRERGSPSCRKRRFLEEVELEGSLPAYLNDRLRMSNEDYAPSGRLSSRVHTPSLRHHPHSVDVSTTPPPHYTSPPPVTSSQAHCYSPPPGTPSQAHCYTPPSGTPSQAHCYTPPPGTPSQAHCYTPHPGTPSQAHCYTSPSGAPSQAHCYTPPPGTPSQVHCYTPHPGAPPQLHSSLQPGHSSAHSKKKGLVSKYLVCCPGNVRSSVDSPGRQIEEKIERLKAECCECKHNVDSLGEDDLSEDLDRLKESLQAERDQYLNHTAQLLPQDNVTVKIGPRDYWSKRMSEFTGKKHRLLFDETLEKIYNRLYTDASHSV